MVINIIWLISKELRHSAEPRATQTQAAYKWLRRSKGALDTRGRLKQQRKAKRVAIIVRGALEPSQISQLR